MSVTLRGYQQQIVNGVYKAWGEGHKVVMPVCATGSGKTKMMAFVARNYTGGLGAAIAHRSQLVAQISLALAIEDVQHNIIAPKPVIKTIVNEHLEETGRSFFNPNARWSVASVATLKSRAETLSGWFPRVGCAMMDEGHHILRDNQWGSVVERLPNAYWMTPTATPDRADGKGLGRDHDGLVDVMVEGPPMRWLIDNGYLTDYRYRGVLPSDLDLSEVSIGSDGDFNKDQVAAAVKRSNKIVGDVVDTYRTNTPGMLGICFAVDIEHGQKITDEFNSKGVPAALMTGDMSEEERRPIMRKYKNREILVLVNVDLFGEGFDLPAIEVVMFARPTASYSLYAQQWGRALRLMISRMLMGAWDTYHPLQRLQHIKESAKPIAYIHDHVGNLLQFNGPPDKPRVWTLARRNKRASKANDGIPMRLCVGNDLQVGCQQPYERSELQCPYCGLAPNPPKERSKPEHVDGDLTLYTPEMLREMFGVDTVEAAEQATNMMTWQVKVPYGADGAIAGRRQREFNEKVRAQSKLRETMKFVMPDTRDARVNDRRFFHLFGIDTVAAKLLGSTEAEELRTKIIERITQ